MEQLPPKAPINMPHPWPSFPFSAAAAAPSSWVDEFLDFSSTRRSAHRRTVSDPIAFVEEEHNSSGGGIGFERLDDEQLRNMFSDEVVGIGIGIGIGIGSSSNPSSVNPSSPSTEDDDKITELHRVMPKTEPGEVDSSIAPTQPPENASADAIFDPKRIKRILANRQSAQRSRVRKLQYISELERSVSTLQTEVSALSPRVAFLDHHRLLLNVDNTALKQRIAALAQDKIFKDAHQEALKKEIERLRKVYHQQNTTKMDDGAPPEAAAAFSKRREE